MRPGTNRTIQLVTHSMDIAECMLDIWTSGQFNVMIATLQGLFRRHFRFTINSYMTFAVCMDSEMESDETKSYLEYRCYYDKHGGPLHLSSSQSFGHC